MNEKIVVIANRTIDEENVKIDRLLQDARESHGVLQSELCKATGLTKNHISAVERGISKASIRMLLVYCEKIAIMLSVPKLVMVVSKKSQIFLIKNKMLK